VGAGKTTFYEAYLKEAFPTLVPPLRHQQQPFLDDRRSFAVEDIRVDTQLLDQLGSRVFDEGSFYFYGRRKLECGAGLGAHESRWASRAHVQRD